ncbi:MAG TPA: S-adenosyl-l-methionine hydroxide adenosyltransferase family protein [Geminicoccaceae bacterium]|nr:S-adenosyl-l-methionine hydroxide adenosyltransferase family protein [Geminicoccaceae bacterium]
MRERLGAPTRSAALAALALVLLAAAPVGGEQPNGILVYETDFGLKDGAVSAMRGVARGVAKGLILEDLTHEIPPFDIWEGAYRLNQTASYWPAGTVFVIVVDPGVGTERKNLVMQSRSGHYFVTPDNGTLTLVADSLGIEAVREIDLERNRLPGSDRSYTFLGRDLFSYTGARLAAGALAFDEVGPRLEGEIVRLDYQKPAFVDGKLVGTISVLDVQYGNVWTNIERATFERLGLAKGDTAEVRISHSGERAYEGAMPYVDTFGDVPEGQPLLYLNSLDNVALAINYGDFAGTHGVASGPDWTIELTR